MSDEATQQAMLPETTRPLAAEALGTMVLVLVGPGTAIIATGSSGLDALSVSLAFGLALLAMAYAIGHVSGCHINPAVTLGFYLMKKIDAATAGMYVAAQVVGGLVGGLLLYAITEGGDNDMTGRFAANGWGDAHNEAYGLGSAIVVEILFTAMLMFVVLSTISKGFTAAAGGVSVGLTLTMIHLVTIPVDNTSVNPARSIAVAFFSDSDAVTQLWAFIVFPLIGAALGVAAFKLIHVEAED